jgi:hypothetical protein
MGLQSRNMTQSGLLSSRRLKNPEETVKIETNRLEAFVARFASLRRVMVIRATVRYQDTM